MTQKSFDCGSSNWLAGYKESRRDGKCGCWTRNCSAIVLHITYLSNGNHRISSAFGIALNDYLTVSSWEFPGNNLRHRRWEMTNGIPMHSLVKVWDQTVDFKCQQCNDTPNYSRFYIYIHILCKIWVCLKRGYTVPQMTNIIGNTMINSGIWGSPIFQTNDVLGMKIQPLLCRGTVEHSIYVLVCPNEN